MRILAVASSYPRRAGDHAGAFVRTGLLALVDRGHSVTVVHPDPGPGIVFEDDPGIRRVVAGGGDGPSALAYREGMPERLSTSRRAIAEAPGLFRALRRTARAEAAAHDAVLSHWLVPGGWVGASAARSAQLPHACVLHSGGVHLLRKMPFGSHMARRIAAGTNAFLAVSEFVRDRFLGLLAPSVRERTRDRVTVVRNPLPASAFAAGEPAAAKRPSILFLGRLVSVKGADVLLAALRAGDDFDVVVAGEGPMREGLEEFAAEQRLPVRFAGHVSGEAKARLLASAAALVVPSRVLADGRTEGAPTVIAESLAAGVPVVAARVGGAPELLRDGDTAWLVPPEDPAALRRALLGAVAECSATRADACRRSAERFRPERFAEAVEAGLAPATVGA